MARKGLLYPVWAPIATETAGSAVTYENPIALRNAILANITYIDSSGNPIFASDIVAENDNGVAGGTITFSTTYLTMDDRMSVLGVTRSGSEGSYIYNITDAPSVPGGFGYIIKEQNTADGVAVITYEAHWIHKVQFSQKTYEGQTKAASVEWKTPSLEGMIMGVYLDATGSAAFEKMATFASYALAQAYINSVSGLSASASTGLSALSLTGTGGTLSPSFGAAIRYYTFGGVTGTSFTVTPTAASHTIEMYVDGVFLQNVTSGSASGSVAIAEVGSKKVTLIAYESGKSAQTTEIIVVKTE